MEQNKEYFVFISYSSLDNEWAIWLRHEVELSAGHEWDEYYEIPIVTTFAKTIIKNKNYGIH